MFRQLYVQMVVGVLAGTALGYAWPDMGVALAPLGLGPEAGVGDEALELLAEELELRHAASRDVAAAARVVGQHHADGELLEPQRHGGEPRRGSWTAVGPDPQPQDSPSRLPSRG